MKLIITTIVFFACAYIGFKIDCAIVSYILSNIPKNEWFDMKIIMWFVVLFFTSGLILSISLLIAAVFHNSFENKWKK
jgi:hypothetical protein